MAFDTKKILLIIAGVALLFVLLAGSIVWFVFQMTAAPVRMAREHLEALNQNDYPRAYSHLSRSLQAELSLDNFTNLVQQNPQVFKTRDSTFSNRKIENDVCTLRGTLTNTEGGVTPVRITLVKEGDQWRIRGFRWGEGATEDKD